MLLSTVWYVHCMYCLLYTLYALCSLSARCKFKKEKLCKVRTDHANYYAAPTLLCHLLNLINWWRNSLVVVLNMYASFSLFPSSHLLFLNSHLLFLSSHLLFQISHFLFQSSHLLFQLEQYLLTCAFRTVYLKMSSCCRTSVVKYRISVVKYRTSVV